MESQSVGCMDTIKHQILSEIEEVDTKDDDNDLDVIMKLERMELISHLGVINNNIDTTLRQNARVC